MSRRLLLLCLVALVLSTVAVAQNHAPTVFAGFPQQIGVASGQSATAELRAYASDPDGDSLSYVWRDSRGRTVGNGSSISVSFSTTGSFPFSVTVNDSVGASASSSTSVSIVLDTNPPVVAPPHDLTIGATDTSAGTARVSDDSSLQNWLFQGGSAEDNVDTSPQRLAPMWNGAVVDSNTVFPEGQSVVTFRWQDRAGNLGTATAKLNVVNHQRGDLFVGGGTIFDGYGWQRSAIFRIRNGNMEQYCDIPVGGSSPNELTVDLEGRIVFLIYTGGNTRGGQILLGRCDAKDAPPVWLTQFRTGDALYPGVPEAYPGTTYLALPFQPAGAALHLERARTIVIDDNVQNGTPHQIDEELYVFEVATGIGTGAWKTVSYHTVLQAASVGPDLGSTNFGAGFSPGIAFHDGNTYMENGNVLRRIKVPLTVEVSGTAGGYDFNVDLGLFGGAVEIIGALADDLTIPNLDSGCTSDGFVSTAMPLVGTAFQVISVGAVAYDPYNEYGLLLASNSVSFGATVGSNVSEALFDRPGDEREAFTNPYDGCASYFSVKYAKLLPSFAKDSGYAYSFAHMTPGPAGMFFVAPSNGNVYQISPGAQDDIKAVGGPVPELGALGVFPAKVSAGNTSAIVIRVNSPVNVLVTDSSGKRIGVDQDGNQVNDFGTNGFDSGPGEPRFFAINNPPPGTFNVQAVGTDTGTYKIDIYAQNWDMEWGSHISAGGTTDFGQLAHHDFAVTPLMQATFVPHNRPPLANAGSDQTVPSTSASGADVTLDGSASSDPDNDTLTYTWAGPFGLADGARPTVTLPVGTNVVELTITDPSGATSTAHVTVTVLPGCAADMGSSISVTRGGFRLNTMTGRFVQSVLLKNTGAAAIAGPVSLVLDSLSSNAALYGATGTTACAAPLGSPYVNVSTGTDGVLSPGESVTVTLQFTDPTRVPITYNTRVLAGTGNR